MRHAPRMCALALALMTLGASAQTLDLGPDVRPFLRFRLYPHLDKAFEAQSKGDGPRAIAEMEQAQRLAPDNIPIALQLAGLYTRFGQPSKGEALLLALRRKHPQDPRLAQALAGQAVSGRATVPSPPEAAVAAVPVAPASAAVAATPSAAVAPVPAPVAGPASRERPAVTRPVASRSAAPAVPSASALPGYGAATAAYAAMARNDAQAALPLARQAVQAAPDHADYQRLLAYALAESDHLEEAQEWADRLASSAGGTNSEMQALGQSVRERRAYARFDAARQALQSGNVEEALVQAQAASALAPNAEVYRLQWLGLLLATGQYARVQQVADEGMAQAGSTAALQVLRAAALQAQGADAAPAFDAALALPSPSAQVLLNHRLVAFDAALASRQFERAEALLLQLEGSPSDALGGRPGELLAARERTLSPASMYAPRWRMPVVNCYGSGGVAGCDVWPGQAVPDPALAIGQDAYRAYSARHFTEAAQLAQQATERNPTHLPYQLLRLQALASSGAVEQALQEVQQILQTPASAEVGRAAEMAEVRAFRSRLLYRLGHRSEAAADAEAALQVGGLSLSSEIDLLLQQERRSDAQAAFASAIAMPAFGNSSDPELAYLATRVGDDRTALLVFDRARAQGRLPVTSLRDGAYTASRLAQTERSVDYFTAAIDAADAGTLVLTPREHFSTRREVADRTRQWGVNALLGYRGITPGSLNTQPALYGDVAQLVGEAYWRPQGFRDGSFWELYGGLAQNLYSREGGATGGQTTQGALGIRAKPLRDHNLVLSLEKRFKIGSLAMDDWLMRVGYSGGRGTDLRVDVPNWTTLNLYAEAGRLLKRRQDYATIEAQAGRSFRMGDTDGRLVLFPHAVLGVDYNSERTVAGYNGAAGAGLGVGVRYWFREDRHNAPRSYLDMSLQYRARLAGDERGKGLFLRLAWVH